MAVGGNCHAEKLQDGIIHSTGRSTEVALGGRQMGGMG